MPFESILGCFSEAVDRTALLVLKQRNALRSVLQIVEPPHILLQQFCLEVYCFFTVGSVGEIAETQTAVVLLELRIFLENFWVGGSIITLRFPSPGRVRNIFSMVNLLSRKF